MSFEWESPTSKSNGPCMKAEILSLLKREGITFPIIVSGVRTTADNGLRLQLDLPEMDMTKAGILYSLLHKVAKCNIVLE